MSHVSRPRRAALRVLAALPLLGLTAAGRVSAPARNADRIREHHAVLDTGDVAAAAMFYAPDTVNHGRPVGRKGLELVLTDILATFPDWRMEIEELAAMDDIVVARMMVSGTHRGIGRMPVNGGLLVGVPPTGRSFEVQHIHWYGMKNGLIATHWAERNDIAMMQQLGLPLQTARSG